MQLSMLEQQAREVQQQIALVNQKINELDLLKISLDKLNHSKEQEFLAPLGEGVFVKAHLQEKELFVNVGSKLVVKKSIKETEQVIDKQISQLEDVRKELEENIENLNKELQHIVDLARKEQAEESEQNANDNHAHESHTEDIGKEHKRGKKK